MKRSLAAGMIALISLTATPVWAAPQEEKDPQALASDGIQSLLKAMEMMLLAIPQYEAPYVNENGDIIIRRKNPYKKPTGSTAPGAKKKAI